MIAANFFIGGGQHLNVAGKVAFQYAHPIVHLRIIEYIAKDVKLVINCTLYLTEMKGRRRILGRTYDL